MKKISKFDQKKPLIIYAKGGPYRKHDLHYNGFEEPKKVELLMHFSQGKTLPVQDYELIFGIEARPEDFTKYDFLLCWEGDAIIVHKRVLEILQKECPEDFQAFPVVVKNFKPTDDPFENRDYVLLNFTHEVPAIDRIRSSLVFKDEKERAHDIFTIKELVLNEDCMEGHLLARSDGIQGYALIHPSLAKKLRNCKGVEFWSDEEKNKP